MADMDGRLAISVVGWDTLPKDKRDWGAAKRVVFEIKIDGHGADHERAPGFLLTVPVSGSWFDDQDVVEVARSRAHAIFQAAANLTQGWARDTEWYSTKKMPDAEA